MSERPIGRRSLLGGLAAGAGGMMLGGCDRLNAAPDVRSLLRGAEQLHYRSQRLLTGPALAREYGRSDMSPIFRVNGNARPASVARSEAENGPGRLRALRNGVRLPSMM